MRGNWQVKTLCVSSVELLDLKSSRFDYRLSCVRSSHMSSLALTSCNACSLHQLAELVTITFKCVKAFSHSSHECVSKTSWFNHNVKVQLLTVDHSAHRSMKNRASSDKRCELQDTPNTRFSNAHCTFGSFPKVRLSEGRNKIDSY